MSQIGDSRDYLISVGFDINDSMSNKQINHTASLLQELENNLNLTEDEMKSFGASFSSVLSEEKTTRNLTALTKQLLNVKNEFKTLKTALDLGVFKGSSVEDYLNSLINSFKNASKEAKNSADEINKSLLSVSRDIDSSLSQKITVDDKSITSSYEGKEDVTNNTAKAELLRLMREENSLQLKINEDQQKGNLNSLSELQTQKQLVSSKISIAKLDSDLADDTDIKAEEAKLKAVLDLTEARKTDEAIAKEASKQIAEAKKQETDALKESKSLLKEIASLESKESVSIKSGDEETALKYQERRLELEKQLQSIKDTNSTVSTNEEIVALEKQNKYLKEVADSAEKYNQEKKEQESNTKSLTSTLDKYAATLQRITTLSKSSTNKTNEIGFNQSQLNEYITSLNKIQGVTVTVDSATGMLSYSLDEVAASASLGKSGIESLDRSINDINDSITKTNAQKLDIVNEQEIKNLVSLYKELGEAQANLIKAKNDRTSSQSDIQRLIDEESRLKLAIEQETDALRLNGVEASENEKVKNAIANANAKAAKASADVEAANKKSALSFVNLKNKIEDAIKTTIQYSVSFMALNQLDNILRNAITTINDLNRAMTDVRIVTGESAESAQQTMVAYAELANEMGVTTMEVAEGSVEWLRQGKTAQETNTLLRNSTMLATLGVMEASDATTKLTAVMNGFNLTVEDSAHLLDSLTTLD